MVVKDEIKKVFSSATMPAQVPRISMQQVFWPLAIRKVLTIKQAVDVLSINAYSNNGILRSMQFLPI